MSDHNTLKHVFPNPQPDQPGPHEETLPSDWNKEHVFAGGSVAGDVLTWEPAETDKARFRTVVGGAGISVTVNAGNITIAHTTEGSEIMGSGTAGFIPKFTGAESIGDSIMDQLVSGQITVTGNVKVTGTLFCNDIQGFSPLTITAPAADKQALVINGVLAQTANILEVGNAGVVVRSDSVLEVEPSTYMSFPLTPGTDDGTLLQTGQLFVRATDSSLVPILIRGFLGQVLNLQEWQDSTGFAGMKYTLSATDSELHLADPAQTGSVANIDLDVFSGRCFFTMSGDDAGGTFVNLIARPTQGTRLQLSSPTGTDTGTFIELIGANSTVGQDYLTVIDVDLGASVFKVQSDGTTVHTSPSGNNTVTAAATDSNASVLIRSLSDGGIANLTLRGGNIGQAGNNYMSVVDTGYAASTRFEVKFDGAVTTRGNISMLTNDTGLFGVFTDLSVKRLIYMGSNNQITVGDTGVGLQILGSVTNTPTFDADIKFSTAASRIQPGATSFSIRNNANSADNLLITDAGVVTVRSSLTTGGAIKINAAADVVQFAIKRVAGQTANLVEMRREDDGTVRWSLGPDGSMLAANGASIGGPYQGSTFGSMTIAVVGSQPELLFTDGVVTYRTSLYQDANTGLFHIHGLNTNFIIFPDSGSGYTSFGGLIKMADAVSRFVPGATSLSFRNNANNADNVLIADAGDVTVRNNFVASGVGPHAIGGATVSTSQLLLTGSTSPTGLAATALHVTSTLNPAAGFQGYLQQIAGTINKQSTGTHDDFVSLLVLPPTIGAGAGALTNSSTVKITAAPSVGTNKRALWVVAGLTEVQDLTVTSGSFIVTPSGPHAIGTTTVTNIGMQIVGTASAAATTVAAALEFSGTMTAGANGDILTVLSFDLVRLDSTFAKNGKTGLDVSQIFLQGSGLAQSGSGTIATASAIKINSAPTIGTTKYAQWIVAGDFRTGGNILMDAGPSIIMNGQAASATTGPQIQFTSNTMVFLGGTSGFQWANQANNAARMTLSDAGVLTVSGDGNGQGVVLGAPTGGNKGSGTLNVATDIFKNNGAYTNPDYVLERWATGAIVRFAGNDGASEYRGLQVLSSVEEYCRVNHALPLVDAVRSLGDVGLFNGGDAVLASLEEAYLYLFDHERRIASLEAELAFLRTRVN